MWPGFKFGVDATCVSLLLVLSFVPRGFSPGTSISPSSQKPTVPNSNATRNQEDEEPLIRCGITKSLLIYFYFIPIYISSNFSLFGLPVWLIKSCARVRFLTKSLWQYFRMSLFAFSFTGYFFILDRCIQSAVS